MHTIQEYLRKLSTEQLERILQEHFENADAYPIEVILDVMDVLVERTGFTTDAKAAWLEFVEHYMPRDDENDL